MRSTIAIAASVIVACILVATPASAEADAPRALPPAASAADAPPWQGVNRGIASIPGAERGVVMQTRGQAWRRLRPPIVAAGGWILAASVAALAAFFLWRGPIGVSAPPTGRLIERFAVADRVAHWTMGLGFVALALTGLVLAAGRSGESLKLFLEPR